MHTKRKGDLLKWFDSKYSIHTPPLSLSLSLSLSLRDVHIPWWWTQRILVSTHVTGHGLALPLAHIVCDVENVGELRDEPLRHLPLLVDHRFVQGRQTHAVGNRHQQPVVQ